MISLQAHTTWKGDSLPKTKDIYLEVGGTSIIGGITYEQRLTVPRGRGHCLSVSTI